jgi:hypothetical protein
VYFSRVVANRNGYESALGLTCLGALAFVLFASCAGKALSEERSVAGSGNTGSGGGPAGFQACSEPTDCLLSSVKCCGACDPVQASNFVAVNAASLIDYQNQMGCAGVVCSPCPAARLSNMTSQYFGATCSARTCTVFDVRSTAYTECESDADCYLRAGLYCCEGCSADFGIVAVSRRKNISTLVCGNASPGCPPCRFEPPAGYSALCVNGRCTASYPVNQ